MNLMRRHTCMFHPTVVLCCCMALMVAESAEEAIQDTHRLQTHRIKKYIDDHNDTLALSHLYKEESLRLIFSRYGENGTMDYEAFENFLKNLGLDEETESHKSHSAEDISHDDHADTAADSHDHANAKRLVSIENGTVQSPQEEIINQCLPADDLYRSFGKNSSKSVITKDDILTICPVLLHQLDTQACKHEIEEEEELPSKKYVWGYGFASVTIISLVSISGILLVPCTKRYPFIYTNLISYLVAVAIGALMGDALLHLLPHSYGVHSHKGHVEEGEEPAVKASTVVWRGTVAVAGILLFFTCEKLMHLRKEKEQDSKEKKEAHDSVDGVHTKKQMAAEPLISNRQPLMSGCPSNPHGNKRASLKGNHYDAHLIHIHSDTQVHQLYESSDIPMVKLECGQDTCETPCEDSTCPEAQCENQDDGCDGVIGNDVRICNSDPEHRGELTEIKEEDEEKGSPGHGHSHKHSHRHSHEHGFAGGIATVAWMVVMGDGLHNFCDGIAIGAAFANSVTGGISTSIAIFCHEIPHEVGDFAVMLKSGMSVRKALAYMGLSSILAYVGMILGVAIGNIEEANLWIFAMTGGMFLYIALVDLLPELLESSVGNVRNIALQSFGIGCGVGIMILIGLYEETLQEALD